MPDKKQSYLQSAAAQAISAGYSTGNQWEKLLDRHMRENLPSLTASLGSDFQAYLTVRTNDAQDLYVMLIQDGTEPRLARSLAIRELLPMAESDLADQIEELLNPYNPLSESPAESNAA